MPSAADERLIARDAGLPGLASVLDPERFVSVLQAAYVDLPISSARATYVRYKPGTSCLVAYRVGIDSAEQIVYTRVHPTGERLKIAKAADRRSAKAGPFPGTTILIDDGIVIYPFPNDHELPGLPELVGDPTTGLAELIPDASGRAVIERLSYKPERRFVGRVVYDKSTSAVVRMYTRADFDDVIAGLDRVASRESLRVPRSLGHSKRLRSVAVEWIDGVTLQSRLEAGDDPDALGNRIGLALSVLHAQSPKRLPRRWTADEFARSTVDAAEAIAAVHPTAAARASSIATSVAEKIRDRHWREDHAIHGDLAPEQIVLDGDRVALIDLDRAALGDPRMDLGTLLARLRLDERTGRLSESTSERLFAATVAAHRSSAKKDRLRKLGRFAAAALLQNAIEPFRRRAPDWADQIDASLTAADEALRSTVMP